MTSSTRSNPIPLLDLETERRRPFRIDPHCHILPGIDDGSPDLATSLAMARRAVAAGIQIAVATPHACHPAVRVPITAEILRQRVASLNSTLEKEKVPLTVLPGQEFLLNARLPEMFEQGELISWADQNRYVLVELGFHSLDPSAWDVLDYFRGRGLTPIIAHPERYTWWDEEPGVLDRLMEREVYFQFNVMSLNRLWGDAAFTRALSFMETGPRWLVGTDSHNESDRFWGIDKVRSMLQDRADAHQGFVA